MLELADEAFAASGQIEISGGVCLRFRKRESLSRGFRARYRSAMLMCGRNRGPVDDETEQQHGQHTRRHCVGGMRNSFWFSRHVFLGLLQFGCLNIDTEAIPVKGSRHNGEAKKLCFQDDG